MHQQFVGSESQHSIDLRIALFVQFISIPLRLTRSSTVLLPIHPAASILGHIGIANLLCKIGSSTTPYTGLAVEYNLFIGRGLAETKAVLKLILGKKQGIWLRFDGEIDGGGDVAGGVLGRLTDVWF